MSSCYILPFAMGGTPTHFFLDLDTLEGYQRNVTLLLVGQELILNVEIGQTVVEILCQDI